MRFSERIKQSNTDEWYTPAKYVDLIVPYLHRGGYHKILCPWDEEKSQFVQVLTEEGFDVTYSHIFTGQDFYEITDFSKYDAVVSNPPFSQREQVLLRLFEAGIPFAVILDFNGIFDNKTRWEMFKANDFNLLIPCGRMRFFNDRLQNAQPPFQSVYVCHGMTDKQIEFVEQPDRQVAMEI